MCGSANAEPISYTDMARALMRASERDRERKRERDREDKGEKNQYYISTLSTNQARAAGVCSLLHKLDSFIRFFRHTHTYVRAHYFLSFQPGLERSVYVPAGKKLWLARRTGDLTPRLHSPVQTIFIFLSFSQTHAYSARALKIPTLKIACREASARLLLLHARRPARPYHEKGRD